MSFRLATILLVIAGTVFAAPVPVARLAKTPQIAPGIYEMTWGGTLCRANFRPDGVLVYETQWTSWWGSWAWSKDGRLLTISETHRDSYHWTTYVIQLDYNLSGFTAIGNPVKLKRQSEPLSPDNKR